MITHRLPKRFLIDTVDRSNAFERSRLMTHNGWSISRFLSKITLKVSNCSSIRYFERNQSCFFFLFLRGWFVSNVSSLRLKIIHAKTLYIKRMLAISVKSVVVRGFDVFGNIFNKVFRQAAGTSPENNMYFNNCSKPLHMSSGISFTVLQSN